MSSRDRLTPGTDVDLDREGEPRRLAPGKRNLTHPRSGGFGAAPGKLTLTRHLSGEPVPVPYRSELEAAFGASLADVQAYLGESEGLSILGAHAAAEGNVIAFAEEAPSRGVVAHEIVHVLQALRSSGQGDPELEADRIEAQVTAGQKPGPVLATATGLMHKDEPKPGELPPLDEDELRVLEHNLALGLKYHLTAIKALEEGPFGSYIKADALDFWAVVVDKLRPICGPGFVRALAPDKVPALTEMAARRGWQEIIDFSTNQMKTKKEPGAFYEDEALVWDLASAIARRWAESIQRVLPRWVKMAVTEFTPIDDKGREKPKELRQGSPSSSAITAFHPMDSVVADALGAFGVHVEGIKFREDNPELVEQAQMLFPRTVAVTFPAERGLFHWVEAGTVDATAEEVAQALFGKTDQAYRLVPLSPMWGFHTRDVPFFKPDKRDELHRLAAQYHPNPEVMNKSELEQFNAMLDKAYEAENSGNSGQDFRDPAIAYYAPDAKLGLPSYEVDPMAELTGSDGAGKMAVERAKFTASQDPKQKGKKHDDLAVYDRLGENVTLLQQIEKHLTSFNMVDGDVQSRIGDVHGRHRKAKETCLADPEGWYALADQQNEVLGRIARGTGECTLQLLMFGGVNQTEDGKTLPDPSKLPDHTRAPVMEVVTAFKGALVALDFPEVATVRCDRAEELLRNLTIAVMEAGLKASNPVIVNALTTQDDRHKDTANYDPKELDARSRGLYGWMARLRVQMAANPAEGQQKLAEVQGHVADLQFEVAVVANLEALDAVWRPLNGSHDFWQSTGDYLRTSGLESLNRTYYQRFRDEVFNPYKSGDPDKKKKAKEAFAALSKEDNFVNHFDRVKKALEDDARHKKWAKIIVAIAVAVVAFGLGQWAGAALALQGLEFALVAAVVELGANTAMNKLIFDENPTIGNLVTGFLFNVGMFAVLSKAARVGKAAGMAAEIEEGTVAAARETSRLSKLGAKAWTITKEGIFVNVLGMVQMDLASRIDKGRGIKASELEELFINNTVQWIGFSIGTRAVDPLLPPHARQGRSHGIDIDGLIKERAKITELAKQVETTRDPELGKQLIEREKAYLEREQKVREQLVELAKKRPELFKKGEVDQLKNSAADDPHAREVMQAQALLGVEEIGPGLYRADPKALDAALHQHKSSGGKVIAIETDPHSGLRTITVQTADAPPIKIKEKLGEGGERAAPLGSPADARAFESWMATAELHKTDPVLGESYRDRLREYWARDPEGALKLASERYGYTPANHPDPSPVANPVAAGKPLTLEAQAGKAFEQYRYQREGDPKQSTGGDPPMNRSEFEHMYKAGYDYDPVRRDWVPRDGMRAGTTGGKAPAGGNIDAVFVGHIHSEAVGLQVLRKLAYGEAEALRVAGIEPPDGINTQTTEWGLMKNPKDGTFILVKGGKGAVDFAAFPGYDAVAHTHPLYDPHPHGGVYQKRELQGKNGDGVLDAKDLAGTATWVDLVYLVPSTGDLGYLSLTGLSHRVKTPFIHLGDGKIGNPKPGVMADGIEFVISNARPIGVTKDGKQFVVFEADITIMAGDTPLHSEKLYQYYADYGTARADQPSFKPPPHDPLPANHPMARLPEIARMGHVSPIGEVQPRTLDQLEALKVIGPDAPPELAAIRTRIDDLLGRMSPEDARDFATIVAHETMGNTSGLAGWIEWAAKQGKAGKDLTNTLADFRQSHRLINEAPGVPVRLGGDANPDYKIKNRATGDRWLPGEPGAQKAHTFDLERTRADGTVESIELYRYQEKKGKLRNQPPGASDVTEGLAHAVEKLHGRQAENLPVGTRIVAIVELPLPFEKPLAGGGLRKMSATGEKTIEVAALGTAGTKSEGNIFTDTTGEGVIPALAAKQDNHLVHEVQVTDYAGNLLARYVRDTTTNQWSKVP